MGRAVLISALPQFYVKRGNNTLPEITFTFEDERRTLTISAMPGQSILEIALANNIYIPHACGGNCACSTCYTHIQNGIKTLPAISEDEEEMLEELGNARQGMSRLSCQCIVADQDLTVFIPTYNNAI